MYYCVLKKNIYILFEFNLWTRSLKIASNFLLVFNKSLFKYTYTTNFGFYIMNVTV